jgi:hypothetical protein
MSTIFSTNNTAKSITFEAAYQATVKQTVAATFKSSDFSTFYFSNQTTVNTTL